MSSFGPGGCVVNPIGPTYYPQHYPYYIPSGSRWKCPDCSGWVSDSVGVHYCTGGYYSTTNKITITSDTDGG